MRPLSPQRQIEEGGLRLGGILGHWIVDDLLVVLVLFDDNHYMVIDGESFRPRDWINGFLRSSLPETACPRRCNADNRDGKDTQSLHGVTPSTRRSVRPQHEPQCR